MTLSVPVLFFIAAVVVTFAIIRIRTGVGQEDENRIKDILRKIYMFALCIVSGAVGLLFLRFDPALVSSLPLKSVDPASETLLLTQSVEFIFGTTSLPIIFEVILANAVMALCFLALPMMVGYGVILLYPSFSSTGETTTKDHHFYDRVFAFSYKAKRTFLVFSHLRN